MYIVIARVAMDLCQCKQIFVLGLRPQNRFIYPLPRAIAIT